MRTKKTETSTQELSPYLKELQKQIQDENFVNNAVERIAIVLSNYIVDFCLERNS